MADLLCSCPHCQQQLTCDDSLAGQELQCPGCQQTFLSPASASPATPTRSGPFAVRQPAPSHPAQRTVPGHSRTSNQPAATGGAAKWVKIGVIVVVLAVVAFVIIANASKWQAYFNEKSRKEAANSDGGEVGHIANVYDVLEATESGGSMSMGGGGRDDAPDLPRRTRTKAGSANLADDEGGANPPEKLLPIIPPVWTLESSTAKIAASRVNGTISGGNFVCESARLDVVGNATVLSLRQGTNASPDREILVYLHPKPGEKIGGGSWLITPDMKGSAVPQVAKRWRPNPKYAATMKSFPSGYALKLELGPIEDGELTGKVFVALPDTEQTVAAGVFKAATSLPDTLVPGSTRTALPPETP